MTISSKNSEAASALFFLPYSIFIYALDALLTNLSLSIILIWFTSLICFYFFNRSKDFLDPRAFFPAFFSMYHTWYPLSVILGRQSSFFNIEQNDLWLTSNLSLLSLLTFINVSNFILMFCKVDKLNQSVELKTIKNLNFKSEKIVFITTLCVVFLSFFFISSSDLQSKSDVNAQGGIVKLLSYYSLLLSTALILIRMTRLGAGFYKDKYFVVFSLLTLLYVGFTGERDVLFRFLICSLLIYTYNKNNFSVFKILLLVFSASILVPLSQAFKAVFISGFSGVNFELATVFSNEFISTSRNLYTLIYFGVDSQPSFLFTDFMRGVLPSAITEKFNIISTSQWFNSHYRVVNNFDGRAGWGFGLVPQGYLIGKELGCMLVMMFSAIIINWSYIKSNKNEYWFVFYLLSLTVLIYAMRADFANLVSQTFKIGGVSVLILYSFHRILVRLNR